MWLDHPGEKNKLQSIEMAGEGGVIPTPLAQMGMANWVKKVSIKNERTVGGSEHRDEPSGSSPGVNITAGFGGLCSIDFVVVYLSLPRIVNTRMS